MLPLITSLVILMRMGVEGIRVKDLERMFGERADLSFERKQKVVALF